MNTRTADRGFSVTELLLVVAVIAVIAAMAVPSFTDIHVRRLEAASSEVANALRHARNESIRTAIPHGVRKLSGQNVISVFRLDTGPNPPVEVFDVSHPVDRGGLYIVDLYGNPRSRATTVAAHFGIYEVASAQEAIAFNSRGEPIDGVSGLPLFAEAGGFVLNNGDRGVIVAVTRLAGKVTSGDVGASIDDPATVF